MSGSSEGSRSVPDSWPALSRLGASTRASGFPPVRAASASTTWSATPTPACSSSSDRTAAGANGGSGSSGDVEGAGERPRLVVAGGEHDDDPFGEQPPGDEQQRVPGGGVEPLEVVDQAQHRFRLAELGQQRQRSQRHQERVEPVPSSSPNATRSARR